jgi:hypothetical protein
MLMIRPSLRSSPSTDATQVIVCLPYSGCSPLAAKGRSETDGIFEEFPVTLMTAYRRNRLTWACIVVVELTIGLLTLYLSKWFAVPFLALAFLLPLMLKGIICPKCGTPVTYQGTFFGARVQGGFIRKKCQQCGWDLNTKYMPSKWVTTAGTNGTGLIVLPR